MKTMKRILAFVLCLCLLGSIGSAFAAVVKSGEARAVIGANLTEEQIQALLDVMKKIAALDIDPAKLLQQAGDLYNKYGESVLSEAKATLDGIFTEEVKASLWDSIMNIFKTLFNAFADFFSK